MSKEIVFLLLLQKHATKNCLGERKNDGPYVFENYTTVSRKLLFFKILSWFRLMMYQSYKYNIGISGC